MHDAPHTVDDQAPAAAGHNHVAPPKSAQWQTPHSHDHHEESEGEADLDLVEAAFVEGFTTSSDPTSFIRLAGVPFQSERDGRPLHLIRVAIDHACDVASITPYLGGAGHRVAPLPASHVGHRKTLAFHYLDGRELTRLSLAEARQLKDLTPPR